MTSRKSAMGRLNLFLVCFAVSAFVMHSSCKKAKKKPAEQPEVNKSLGYFTWTLNVHPPNVSEGDELQCWYYYEDELANIKQSPAANLREFFQEISARDPAAIKNINATPLRSKDIESSMENYGPILSGAYQKKIEADSSSEKVGDLDLLSNETIITALVSLDASGPPNPGFKCPAAKDVSNSLAEAKTNNSEGFEKVIVFDENLKENGVRIDEPQASPLQLIGFGKPVVTAATSQAAKNLLRGLFERASGLLSGFGQGVGTLATKLKKPFAKTSVPTSGKPVVGTGGGGAVVPNSNSKVPPPVSTGASSGQVAQVIDSLDEVTLKSVQNLPTPKRDFDPKDGASLVNILESSAKQRPLPDLIAKDLKSLKFLQKNLAGTNTPEFNVRLQKKYYDRIRSAASGKTITVPATLNRSTSAGVQGGLEKSRSRNPAVAPETEAASSEIPTGKGNFLQNVTSYLSNKFSFLNPWRSNNSGSTRSLSNAQELAENSAGGSSLWSKTKALSRTSVAILGPSAAFMFGPQLWQQWTGGGTGALPEVTLTSTDDVPAANAEVAEQQIANPPPPTTEVLKQALSEVAAELGIDLVQVMNQGLTEQRKALGTGISQKLSMCPEIAMCMAFITATASMDPCLQRLCNSFGTTPAETAPPAQQ